MKTKQITRMGCICGGRDDYCGPLVIRTPVPEGAIDIAATFDAERAEQRRRMRAEAQKRSWLGRVLRPDQVMRSIAAKELVS